MSIKNDIEMVREELTSEEKFFEKSVITEKFIKKYKNVLIGSAVVVFLGIGANITYEVQEEARILSANSVLNKLQTNTTDAVALAELKEISPSLYNAFVYSQAIANKDMQTLESLRSTQTQIIKSLADYESVKDLSSLDSYTLQQNAMFKDLAIVRAAIALIQNGETQKAHAKLALISDTSSLQNIAQSLLHYGVK
ncbi:hypothetical protein JHD48_02155 [Sulfurimonas sp. SAG-AH-194-I05]|nr:hypothetical protein [Sulfurimonas sp. SAG-AH-194-I05]MDF1874531.1 hypothetical protein [Sulfurimonas sp. SAG-AH-194-I05]